MKANDGKGAQNRVALTGSSGFIGSAVLDELSASDMSIAALTRRPVADINGRVEGVMAEDGLSDPISLDRLLFGAETLVHAASYVGSDKDLQQKVNVDGTRRLVSKAQEHGVGQIIYVSTASVYGAFPWNGAKEGELEVHPGSLLSASRARAEEIVLEAGGTVLRPHLVYGEGDRWFLSQYLAMTGALDAWVGGGTARISVIDRMEIGRLVAALVRSAPVDQVLHICSPEPAVIGELARQVLGRAGVRPPLDYITLEDALAVVGPRGVRESQMVMVAQDNWLDSRRVWELTGMTPQARPVLDPSALAWYAENYLGTVGL